MITVFILENNDIITPTDYCRPLYIISMDGGRSDYYSFSTLGGLPENNTKWITFERAFPFFIGYTVGEFRKQMEEFNDYEVVRGNIPSDHICPLEEVEILPLYEEILSKTTVKAGKYSGWTWYDVYNCNRNYFEWACDRGYMKSFRKFKEGFESD